MKFSSGAFASGRVWPLQTFETLLQSKAEVNMHQGATILSIIDSGVIPLVTAMLASARLRQEITDLALLHCASVLDPTDGADAFHMVLTSRPTIDGASLALIEAVRRERIDMVQELLQHGALPDFQDDAAVGEAVSTGHAPILALFLNANLTNSSLTSAFQAAVRFVNPQSEFECMESILRAGLHGDIVDQHLIDRVRVQPTPIEEVSFLLDNKASVHAQESRSLILAATSEKSDVLRLLFAKVALPDVATRCFRACLTAGLVQSHEVGTLEFLLKSEVDQALKDEALTLAVENTLTTSQGKLSMIKMLVEQGAQADCANGQALCMACKAGRPDEVSAILQSRPSASLRSRALHFALKSAASSPDLYSILNMIMAAPSPPAPLKSSGLDATKPTFAGCCQSFESPIRVFLKARPRDAHGLRTIRAMAAV